MIGALRGSHRAYGIALLLPIFACGRATREEAVLHSDTALHLEDHLGDARVEGSHPPRPIPAAAEWRFSEPQSAWKIAAPANPAFTPARLERVSDAIRLTIAEGRRDRAGGLAGGLYIDLPAWRPDDWDHLLVRARSSGGVNSMGIGINVPTPQTLARITSPAFAYVPAPFERAVRTTAIVGDGAVHTYQIRPQWRPETLKEPWRRLGLWFSASEPASIDILSVSVVPKAAMFAQERLGLRTVAMGGTYRRSLITHAPARVTFRMRVPANGRFHTAFGVLRSDTPVEFRVIASDGNGAASVLLRESYSNPDQWAERGIDLTRFAGKQIALTLETSAKPAGTVALWGAPTVSGARRSDKPNVIFYVFDGGGADYMSVYGYNRRTTPNLEKLAAEGALFERAYSNSSWTKPSTTTLMTSLQSSVLGNNKERFGALPAQAVPLAEHFHRAGYQTAVMTTNPWAGSSSGLERGADVLRDTPTNEKLYSSLDLHNTFWRWRERNPGQPYWVHLQSTDVHWDFDPRPPFAGMFVSPDEAKTWRDWKNRLRAEGGTEIYSDAFKKTGISRIEYFTLQQAIYDQCMAMNDYELGRLVDRLKASGEWQNTLLVVTADHSVLAAADDIGVALLDPLPPRWVEEDGGGPMFRPSISRVPLLFVWPGRIRGGQRFAQPVSLIDVLPTVLNLTGLPLPGVRQGQSLAPLLRGEAEWRPRPVILELFDTHAKSGKLRGRVEVVDGRWGASLWIGPPPDPPYQPRPTPVVVFDLWNDPFCVQPINAQRPDLVRKYTKFLNDTWKDHQALATRFTAGRQAPLTEEQLARLRALGYIR